MSNKKNKGDKEELYKLKHQLLTILAVLVTVTSINFAAVASTKSDFQAGWNAYQDGNFISALKIWEPLAEKGDPRAQFNIGVMYAEGKGRELQG